MKKVHLGIHHTRRFAKELQAMHKAGNNERAAAKRAEKIIADLQANPLHDKAECKRTRHGELRLRSCRKYDLSCGFRLIGLKRDRRLIFTCIGSHDDCQRWIENNREHQDEIESTPVPVRPLIEEEPKPTSTCTAESAIDEYEEQLMAQVDDQLLLEIFPGLLKRPVNKP